MLCWVVNKIRGEMVVLLAIAVWAEHIAMLIHNYILATFYCTDFLSIFFL